MEITEVKVFPVSEEKLKAFVSIVFDHCFMVNDVKIIQGRQGLFISMPSRKKKNGEFKDVAHPLNNETRQMIEGRILSEYERVLGERGGSLEEETEPPGTTATLPSRRADGPVEVPPASPEPLPAAAQAAGGVPEAVEKEAGKSLEEVEEIHLRDSFWTVP